MRLLQGIENGQRFVARSDGAELAVLDGATSVRELALEAIAAGGRLAELVANRTTNRKLDYHELARAGGVQAPIDHPDAAHCWVTGTGITHLGSASGRDEMHSGVAADGGKVSDSMRLFQLGLSQGKPRSGEIGALPEWFYKGDGLCIVAPDHPLAAPAFGLSGAEEAEIVGVYVIAPDGAPWRIGFCLGNEFSDHVIEEKNYLYGAHSKLRPCSLGPELLIGDLPGRVDGVTSIYRNGALAWQGAFASGEENMCHSIANLEHHHFKYAMFRRPGDVHCHFFGASTFSYAQGFRTQPGDRFRIEADVFGRPLENILELSSSRSEQVRALS